MKKYLLATAILLVAMSPALLRADSVAPIITLIYPSVIQLSDPKDITGYGSNLEQGMTIFYSGSSSGSFQPTYVSPTKYSFNSSRFPIGSYSFYVQNPDGKSSGSLAFKVAESAFESLYTSVSTSGTGVTKIVTPPPVGGSGDGICGSSAGGSSPSAPTTGLCNSGTASAISGTGPFTWSCTATGSGASSATCSASLGSGGTTNNVTCNPAAGEVFGSGDVQVKNLGYAAAYLTPEKTGPPAPASGALGVSFKFTPDNVNFPNGYAFATYDPYGNVPKDFVVSDCPHRFTGAIAPTNPFGAVVGTSQNEIFTCNVSGGIDEVYLSILWTTTPNLGPILTSPSRNCILNPNKDYYVNIRPTNGIGTTQVYIQGRNR